MKRTSLVFIALICLSISGCSESKDTVDAKLHGSILVDAKGNKWVARHKLGDVYHLYLVREDGGINWR